MFYEGAFHVADLEVVTRVNGAERQRGRSSEMVFSIPAVVAYISRLMTLVPGDLIATGTPSGVGRLTSGDEVEVELVQRQPLAEETLRGKASAAVLGALLSTLALCA